LVNVGEVEKSLCILINKGELFISPLTTASEETKLFPFKKVFC
jgi:hypothetical protein